MAFEVLGFDILLERSKIKTTSKIDFLGTNFRRGNENIELSELFEVKEFICLFFGAGWCPISRNFMKTLKNLYKILNKSEKTIEILFVSSDENEDNFEKYYCQMPW